MPFGGIERADRTIAWPPAQDQVFDCFGVREAPEPCELTASVAVVGVVVRVAVQRGRDPQAAAQRREFGADVVGRDHPLRERGLEHRAGADHVALDRLPDALHGLVQEPARDGVDRVARGAV